MAGSYPSQSHDPYEYAWLVGIGLGAVFALWYFAGGTINGVLLHIKQAQLWLLLHVWPDNSQVSVLYSAVNRSLQDPERVSFKRDGKGVWRAEIPIPSPGRYSYKLVVNRQRWVEDPSNGLKEPDNHGGLNSVLDIK